MAKIGAICWATVGNHVQLSATMVSVETIEKMGVPGCTELQTEDLQSVAFSRSATCPFFYLQQPSRLLALAEIVSGAKVGQSFRKPTVEISNHPRNIILLQLVLPRATEGDIPRARIRFA
jgi:hypothetical protein